MIVFQIGLSQDHCIFHWHSIGLIPELTRYDRNIYFDFYTKNITRPYMKYYKKETKKKKYFRSFDYGFVMMPSHSFGGKSNSITYKCCYCNIEHLISLICNVYPANEHISYGAKNLFKSKWKTSYFKHTNVIRSCFYLIKSLNVKMLLSLLNR
uniref:Astacin domain-containing protein n=1 Tax=Strongyloides venezuelensis TaxID=75913 RepID=A0A0K0FP76_STRVS